jgi:L-lysine 6-transaminase
VDLPDPARRNAVLARMHREERVLVLGCGERSIRFRPALTVAEDECDLAVAALQRAVTR